MPNPVQPCLLYKQGNIAYARENLERYAWAQEIVEDWRRSTAFARRQDRESLDAFIPELTPGTHYGQNCPHCVGEKSLMGGGSFDWLIDAPDQLTCSHCGTVYPHADYPETGVVECPRMGQRFTYYQPPGELENPDRRNEHALCWLGDRPVMTSFSGHIRYCRAAWAWRQSIILAKLYAVTEDVACAERVVWILDRFAKVFPNYLFHSYDGSIADWPPLDVAQNMGERESGDGPRGGSFPRDVVKHAYGLNTYDDHSELFNGFWGAGRISVHGKGSDAGPILDFTIAYDLVRAAERPGGEAILDAATERRILKDLILNGCTEMECWVSLTNKGTAVYALSAAVGILLGQPERVRRGIRMFDQMLFERYHHDGFYAESPGYSAHNFSNVHDLADLLHSYSDPPDYRSEQGDRVDNVDYFSSGRFHLSLLSLVRQLAPGQRMPIIGDTKYPGSPNILCAEVLAARLGGEFSGLLESLQGGSLAEKGSEYSLWYRPPALSSGGARRLPLRSEWFPGWHVGVLRGGRGEQNDTALFLNGNEHNWTVRTGHRQSDILSMSFYAFGQEVVPDLGYFSGSSQLLPDGRSGQAWARSSLSHNLVVVDEESQLVQECGSDLELFGTAPGVEVVQAAAVNVYLQCEDYRRTCVLVKIPNGQSYVVDLFRVKGGQVHHYCLHGSGSMTGMSPDSPMPRPTELSEAWRTWVESAEAVSPEGPMVYSWKSGAIGLDLTVLGESDRIIQADAPGWRSADPLSEIEKPAVRKLMVERRAADHDTPLTSQFVAVLAASQEKDSPVIQASLLESDTDSGMVAIEVRLEGRTDYIISTRDRKERILGPVTVSGEFSVVSVDDDGGVMQAYLLNGTRCSCGDMTLESSEPNRNLEVISVEDRTFHLGEKLDRLPEAGSYLLAGEIARTGFEIESATQRSITVRDYPAIECNAITILNSRSFTRADRPHGSFSEGDST